MDYKTNKISGINIAYIGGGSKGWAWNLMSDLALEKDLSGTVKLYDLNYESAKNNALIGNKLSQREDVKGQWKYEAVETFEAAVTGSDFIIISILPGTFDEMDSDVHLPEKYGIYQSVGDTVGPGGLMRALRTIPMYIEIAENIKKYAPNAWVINYTNPMTLCVKTLYEAFPEIKAFGCCHEVFGTQKLLVSMIGDMLDIKDISRDKIKINVLGINHFTWFDSASYKNIDLFPLYKEFANKYYEEGFDSSGQGNWLNDSFASANRVKFDLFLRYGLIAAAGDRHLAEFMPPWYLKDPETVKSWRFGLTQVSWRKNKKVELEAKSKRLASGEEEVKLKQSGEEGIKQIKALLGLGDFVTNVNIPNQGQVKNLPIDAVVETNALFGRDSIKPVFAGELPTDIQSLIMRHVLNQETILNAALNKDKELAFKAFVNDPLVRIDIKDARELFEQMLKNTKNYLPGWDL